MTLFERILFFVFDMKSLKSFFLLVKKTFAEFLLTCFCEDSIVNVLQLTIEVL